MLDRLDEIQQCSAECIVGDVGVGIHTAIAFLEHLADVHDVDLPATTVFVVEPVDPGVTFSFDTLRRISAHSFPPCCAAKVVEVLHSYRACSAMKSGMDGSISSRSAQARVMAAISSLTSRDQPSVVLKAKIRTGDEYWLS